MDSNLSLCVGTLFRKISSFECLISRILGTILIMVAIFSIIFNIRFIYWSSYHRHSRPRHYSLILSMIISSISVIIVISPSVFIQCLSCTRLCSKFYCQFEGFVSYLNGCVHMFVLMIISLIRGTTVLQSNLQKRFFEQHSFLTIIICWLFGLIFALPPLFNWNRYMPEGIGLHCGLDWFDRSLNSIIYFILTFAFVYFIPLIVLSIVNIYVYCIIRNLLYQRITTDNRNIISLNSSSEQKTPARQSGLSSITTTTTSNSGTSSNATTTVHSEKFGYIIQVRSNSGSSRSFLQRRTDTTKMNHLQRLQADRRFALATIFLVSEYLLSWTPYAIVALFYLCNVQFINPQSILMTICAFIAKISMILNPFIYIATTQTKQLNSILFCQQCACARCRVRRNVASL